MALVGVVFVHGLFSSRKVWAEFGRLIGEDPDLGRLELRYFEYASPRLRFNPVRRIPSFNDLGDSLATYLGNDAAHLSTVVLVTHSQGGLVVQRFLARTLFRGRGLDLAPLHQVVMFACPNDGSEFARSLRRMVPSWWRSPQEHDLQPLNVAVTEAREAVLNRVVHAKSTSAHEYPVRIHVYAGETDNIVKPESARSVFPDAGTLPGDHFGIVRPDGPEHRSFVALRRHLLETLDQAEPPRPASGRTGSWQRPIVGAVREAIAASERRIVVYGLPRTGKTTVIADALDGGRAPDRVVLSTSVVQPDDGMPARLIAVPPLSWEESRSLLEHEIAGHGLSADVDQLLRILPAGPLSLPGALRAYVAEIRHTPPEMLAVMPPPATVAAETAPVAALVGGLSADDAAALARIALLSGVPLTDLLEAGLVGMDALGPAIRRLAARCLVSQYEGRVEVPTVVVDSLGPDLRSAAARQIADRVRSLARASVETALAAALPVLARNWLALGVFDHLDVSPLVEQLNRQGHWNEYVALTQVLIDVLDKRGDVPRAISTRCRLARKVAQQGDIKLGWSLLREANALVDSDGPMAARAELHSHRAFLAHLQGDSAYALQELDRSMALRSASDDPHGVLMAHKLEGNIQLRLGEHEAAAECFAAALTVDATAAEGPRLEAEVSLAHCEFRMDRLDAAGERLDRVIRQMRAGLVRTELPRALRVAALLAERRGLPAQALDLARQAAESDARDPATKAAIERTVWRLERFGSVHTGQRGEPE